MRVYFTVQYSLIIKTTITDPGADIGYVKSVN